MTRVARAMATVTKRVMARTERVMDKEGDGDSDHMGNGNDNEDGRQQRG
jgi:hypothetical protein